LSNPPLAPDARVLRSRKAKQAAQVLETELDLVDIDEDAEPDEDDEDSSPAPSCKCTNQKSPVLIMIKKEMRSSRLLTDPQRSRLIDAWYEEVSQGRRKRVDPLNYERLCFIHTRAIATKMGIFKRAMDATQLHKVLTLLYLNKDRWDIVQSDEKTSLLFVKKYQLRPQMDDMLSYRYRPQEPRVIGAIDWDKVAEVMGVRDLIAEFWRTGSIIEDGFKWLLEDDYVADAIDHQFRMYDYHQRRIDGRENLGWLRCMYHSLVQQVVRGDIWYWLLYAMIRKTHTFVAYPYYTKYAKPGDRTAFKHVDLNLHAAITTGVGAEMIQGSASFTDEDEDNCTLLLLGFHRHVPEYLTWRELHRKHSTGYIEGWDDAVDWPAEIKDRWKEVVWTKQPCSAGQIRISHPLLPHGSTGPTTKERRTILPWFCLVRNGEMENPAMGTYDEICKAHRELIAAPRSPSGHPNKYGGVKWAFPADVHINFRSEISKALHGQVRWDNPLVRKELRDVFDGYDGDKIQRYINTHRQHMINEIKRLFPLVRDLEKDAFRAVSERGIPSRSYFATSGVHPPREGATWSDWDKDITQEDALQALVDELGMEPDERIRHEERLASESRQGSVLSSPPRSPPSSPPRSPPQSPPHSPSPHPTPTPLQRQRQRAQTVAPAEPPRAAATAGRARDRAQTEAAEPRRSERLRRQGPGGP
jgi:hypothetical protein